MSRTASRSCITSRGARRNGPRIRRRCGSSSFKVDGEERQAVPWPDWAITTVIDTSSVWPAVWRAVQCHKTQMTIYTKLEELPEEHQRCAVGHAGVLPRLQPRQWRPRAGIGSVRGVAMNMTAELEALRQRKAPLDMQPGEFREIGHRLVDRDRRLAGEAARRPGDARRIAGGRPAGARRPSGRFRRPAPTPAGWSSEATGLLFDHSLFNGHPRFFGYITSSPAPIGDVRRFPGRRRQPERRGVAAVAARDRDRRRRPCAGSPS